MKNKPLKDRKQITLTFTEEGRQTADAFCDESDCIVATQLLLLGVNKVREHVECCYIDGVKFEHEKAGNVFLCCDSNATQKPFYGPEVVGKKLVLRRVK